MPEDAIAIAVAIGNTVCIGIAIINAIGNSIPRRSV
jgi:hypothetical protein